MSSIEARPCCSRLRRKSAGSRARRFGQHFPEGSSRRLTLELLEQRLLLDGAFPSVAASLPDSPWDLREFGPMEVAVVTFSEEIVFDDGYGSGSFSEEDITILGPDGPIAALEVLPGDGNAFGIRFSPQTARGTYVVSVGPEIVDVEGNPMEEAYTFDFDAYAADTVFGVDEEPTYIDSDNTVYDGQDICVLGVELTIDGIHEFASLHLIEGATVTHSSETSFGVGSLPDVPASFEDDGMGLSVLGDLIIDESSAISADGKGYSDEGPGAGADVWQEGIGAGGGGYGGRGGAGSFAELPEGPEGGEPYGEASYPVELGSEGGQGGELGGGAGGGAMYLSVSGTMVLDGRISANGADGETPFPGGGGSGGSIFLDLGTLTGTGTITANGGSGGVDDTASPLVEGGGGSGGRIALHYDRAAGFDLGGVVAAGGPGFEPGGDGTVVLRQRQLARGMYPGEEFRVADVPMAMVAGDLNGDQHIDVVTGNFDGTVSVLLGDGDGMLREQGVFLVEETPTELLLADLNGDDMLDLVAGNATGLASVLLNIGNGMFSDPLLVGSEIAPAELIAVGDLNGDNVPDLTTAERWGDKVSTFLGNGDGTFGAETTAYVHIGGYLESFDLGDLNGDGHLDLVVADETEVVDGEDEPWRTPALLAVLGNGDGTFTEPDTILTGPLTSQLSLGDVNGDSILDIVSVNRWEPMFVTLGNGNATFGDPIATLVDTPGGPWALELGDFNADQRMDMVTANWMEDDDLVLPSDDPGRKSISVFLSNGDGTFADPTIHAQNELFTGIALGDVTADGVLDILVSGPDTLVPAGGSVWNDEGGSVAVIRGGSDGTFAVNRSLQSEIPSFALAIGDINNDSMLDVVSAGDAPYVPPGGGDADPFPLTFASRLGNGNGELGEESFFGVPGVPNALALADVNSDGDLDVISKGTPESLEGTEIFVSLGQGDGSFQFDSAYATGNGAGYSSPWSLAIGDVNNDTLLDVVSADEVDGTVSVLLGMSDGTFQDRLAFSAGTPVSVTLGDIDGDGALDIVTTDGDDPVLTVLFGQSDGTFSPRAGSTYSIGGWGDPTSVGDLNNDGVLDVVTALEDGWVVVLLGQGDGTLKDPRRYSIGAEPYSMALGDVNGDGAVDVVASGYWSWVSVQLGNGDGTLDPATFFDAGATPVAVGLADLDNSGLLDVVTGYDSFVWDSGGYDFAGISVLLNQWSAGPAPLQVVSHQPSGRIEGPVESIEIDFNGDVDWQTFSIAEDVASFSGPDGDIAVLDAQWIDGDNSDSLILTFAQQFAPGAYELVLGPEVFNLDAIAMDQDGDRTPGELPDDQYVARFSVLGPYVVNHQPTGDQSQPVSEVIIEFSEPMNAATFMAEDVEIVGPAGPVAIDGDPIHIGGNSFRITFPEQATNGMYHVYVGPQVENAYGRMDQDRDGSPGEYPDDRYEGTFVVLTGPRVVAHEPSGEQSGPISAVVIEFNEVIDFGTFSADDVEIVGPAGPILVQGQPTHLDGHRYQISIPPQIASGTYHIYVGPEVWNVHGVAMDQDGDWTPGEPVEDRYEGTFIIPPGPYVIDHEPSGDQTRPISEVVVEFNEPILATSFTADDVTIVGPLGNVSISADPAHVAENRYRIAFPEQTADGAYHVHVGPDIQNLVGVSMDQDRDGTQGEPVEDRYDASFAILAGPYVAAHTPSGDQIEPVSAVDVTFNEPIRLGTFMTQDVEIQGPAGPIDASQVVRLDAATYQIRFTSQAAHGAYHIYVGPHVENDSGLEMDQDRDGVIAEPVDDRYDASFTIIDVVGPHVTEYWPDTPVRTLSSVLFTFNEPIDETTFTPTDVSIQGPNGTIDATVVALLGVDRFSVQFPVQSVEGTYSVSVGPAVTDLVGNLMDQDQDGLKGESDDTFTAIVELDLTPPTVLSHSLDDVQHTMVTEFEITFDEPINPATFRPTYVTVTGPLGTQAANSIQRLNETTFHVQVPGNAVDGDYEVTIDAAVADLAGNRLAEPYTFAFQQQLADLRVTDVTYPRECLSAQEIEIRWTVTNVGEGVATGGWQDVVYFDEEAMTNDIAIQLRFDQPLGPMDSYTRAATFTVPSLIEGNRWITVFTDSGDELSEVGGDSGNVFIATPPTWVTARPYADLQVADVIVPSTLSAGEKATVSWSVVNQGTGATSASFWHDNLYLSTDSVLDTADIELASVRNPDFLAAGESYTQTVDVTIPEMTLRDDYYLIVKADAQDMEEEFGLENNNIGRSTNTAEVITPSLGFLTVVSFEDPGIREPGSYIGKNELSWTLQNTGGSTIYPTSAACCPDYWDDGIAISRDEFYDENEDHWLDGHLIHHTTPLGPGETRVSTNKYWTHSIHLPNWAPGTYYLILVPDTHWRARTRGQQVPKDYGVVPITLAYRESSDLTVTTVSSPASGVAGQNIQIDWHVENQSIWGTREYYWYDKVHLSSDQVLDDSDVALGSRKRGGLLNAGAGYDVTSASFRVPGDVAGGNYYILLETDATNREHESDETNNVLASATPIAVTRPIECDLEIVLAGAPATGIAGESIAIEWTVINNGPAGTPSGEWSDAVYLSEDAIFDTQQDMLLDTFDHVGVLEPGQEYNWSIAADLPDQIEGTYSLFVVTDAEDDLYEHSAEHNNVYQLPETLEITDLAPDLAVANFSAPATAIAGRVIDVDWLITNAGTEVAGPGWQTTLYLSQDNTLNTEESDPLADDPLVVFTAEQPLALGDSHGPPESPAQVALPDGIEGTYYLFLAADSGEEVYERDLESNNVTIRPIEITDLVPDLHIQSATADLQGRAGEYITVDYTGINTGEEATSSSWKDAFYLSGDEEFDPEADQLFGLVQQTSPVGVDETYVPPNKPTYLRLPDRIEGTYRIFMVVDSDAEVDEKASEANNLYLLPEPIEIALTPADLLVGDVQIPAAATAGTLINVAWTVTNEGPKPTEEAVWSDGVYLSLDDTFEPAGDIELGVVPHTGPLGPGESYSQREYFELRQDLEGTFFLYVAGDLRRQVFEHDGEDNNITAAGHTMIVTGVHADLQVTDLDVPATSVAGSAVNVSWTVTNVGPDATPGSHWSDSVYLSEDGVLDASDRLLGTFPYNGRLPDGGSYAQSRSLDLPEDVEGTFNIIVKTDSSDRNDLYEYQAESNNTAVAAIQVSAIPPADLEVTQIVAPLTAWSGQTMLVEWTVTNTGGAIAETDEGSWFDSVYVSRDPYLDREADIHLGAVLHEGSLSAGGGFYNASLDSRLPAGISGPFYVFVLTDTTNRLFERDAEDNNASVAPSTLQVNLTPPADLIASGINMPAFGFVGESAVWSYQVANAGAADAVGQWYDTLYLSSDQTWDLDDTPIGRALHRGDVAHGESYAQSVQANIPPVLPGEYYVIVRTDILDQVRESVQDELNNATVSTDRIAIDSWELALDMPDNSHALQTGYSHYFEIQDVPAGKSLKLALAVASGTASPSLFVSHAHLPTRSQFDSASSAQADSARHLVVPTTEAGSYFVLVYGDRVSGGPLDYGIEATIPSFAVYDQTYGKGGTAGNLTVEINGADFDRTVTARLADGTGFELPASAHYYVDNTRLFATFDLTQITPGYYDVVVHNGEGATAIVADGLEVVPGGGWTNRPEINVPSLVRWGRELQVTVTWGNDGLNDVPAPLLTVRGSQPFGLSPGDRSAGQRYEYLGISTADSPAGILRPGQHENMTFYSLADPGLGEFRFSVDRKYEDLNAPFGWESARQQFRPTEMSMVEFDPVFEQLVVQVGPTNRDFLLMLSKNASLLPAVLQQNRQPASMLAIEIDLALSAVSRSITGSVTGKSADDQVRQYIIAENISTKQSFDALILTDGSFVLPGLPEGDYHLLLPGYDLSTSLGDTIRLMGATSALDLTVSASRYDVHDRLIERGLDEEIAAILASALSQDTDSLWLSEVEGAALYTTTNMPELLGTFDVDPINDAIRNNTVTPELIRDAQLRLVALATIFDVLGAPHAADHIANFFAGTGLPRDYVPRSYISTVTEGATWATFSHRDAAERIRPRVIAYIEAALRNGSLAENHTYTFAEMGIGRPQGPNFYLPGLGGFIPPTPPERLDLIAGFGDMSGNHDGEVTVNVIRRTDCYGCEVVDFNATIRYKWRDLYTFHNDLGLSVFDNAAYYLEHVAHVAKAFETSIEVDEDIEGSLALGGQQLFDVCQCPNVSDDCGGGGGAGSHDPNDKLAPVGYDLFGYIQPDSVLPYTVRFENDPEATASAVLVTITDQLDDDVDWATFELGNMQFGDHLTEVPAGLTYYTTRVDLRPDGDELLVDVTGNFDPDTGIAQWAFTGIDPATGELTDDPLAGFLPPNNPDVHDGEGFVEYSVLPKADLPSGTEIDNMATIVFDWNEPIDTPMVRNTIDAGAPQSAVDPLPAVLDGREFQVSWAGADDPNGSGIRAFDVYVATGAGKYQVWLKDTSATAATFPGEYGHVYAFYSVATDNVGHSEVPPAAPDAVTSTPPGTGSVGDRVWLDIDADGVQDIGEPGFGAVGVSLYDASGAPVANTSTDDAGYYRFDGLDTDQDYYIEFAAPNGYLFSPQGQDGNDSRDSDVDPASGRTIQFAVGVGQHVDWDAGLYKPAEVRGVLWDDADEDGEHDEGEGPLAGWTVFLEGPDGNGVFDQDTEPSTITDDNGNYLFTGLTPGEYVVREIVPNLWEQTYPGSEGADDRQEATLPLMFNAAEYVQSGGSSIQALEYSVPTMVDWNNDGLDDLLVGEKVGSFGKVRVYLNEGQPGSPDFAAPSFVQADGGDLLVPAAGCLGAFPRVMDWNGDGLKDLLVGLADGRVKLFLNVNSDSAPEFAADGYLHVGQDGAKADVDVGSRATIDVADWNADGKLDLILGALDGKVRVYLNEGTSNAPNFRAEWFVQDAYGDLVVPGGRSSVDVEDLDGDGLIDLVVGKSSGDVFLYLNIGSDTVPKFDYGQRLQAGGEPIALPTTRSRPFLHDVDGDGLSDLLVGGQDGLVRLYTRTPATPGSGSLTTSGSTAELFLPGFEAAAQIDSEAANLINLEGFRTDPRFAHVDGSNMTVVVIDTGIDLDHPFFGSDVDGDGVADRIVFQYDFADGDNDASDVRGHGSNVTSILASGDTEHTGIAPAVDIIHLKVFGDDGHGQFSYAEQALQWVVSNAEAYNIAAVNLSFGDRGNWDEAAGRFGVGDELDALAAMDVIVVASAGNSFATHGGYPGVSYPAADPNTIAVGAVWDSDNGGPWDFGSYGTDYTTGADRITVFSQRHGELLDVFAPGAVITGANAYGGTMAMSGTSQAAPFVTGAAVLAQQIALETIGRPITPTEFHTLLSTTGRTIIDGDDEDDSVMNTGLSFKRMDMLALAEAIATLDPDNPDRGDTDLSDDPGSDGPDSGGDNSTQPHALPFAHTIRLVSGESREGVDFGNKLLNDPPVADPNGPYVLDQGADLQLDASGSSDPNAAFGDSIVSFEWDLDNDGEFDDAFGEQPSIPWETVGTLMTQPANPVTGLPSNPISLRVVDSFGETNTASTSVTVYHNQPTANFDFAPSLPMRGQTVTFDAGTSTHGHPSHTIASYQWDLDNDGQFDDASGPVVQHTFVLPGNYHVGLRVTDDNAVARTDTVARTVEVQPFPTPPHADADGPYLLAVGIDLVLDATGSFDPDEDLGDHIVSYEWDIDNDGVYDVADSVPAVTVPWGTLSNWTRAVAYTVRLRVTDMEGLTDLDSASVTIDQNEPVATNDSTATDEDTPVTLDVLANDTDADGDTLSVVSITNPAHGTATINSNSTVTYTPEADYHGPDSFGYTASDGNGGEDTATVSIAVIAVNDAPLTEDDLANTAEDTSVTIDVLANDTDVDGDVLAVLAVTAPAHGTATINSDGTVAYTPEADFNGSDLFDYTASDGNGGENTATVSIMVTAVNDDPVASDDAYGTDEDTPLSVTAPGVLSNDSDLDGDALTAVLASDASNGALTFSADGSFLYTPNADWNGTDSFTYQAQDPVLELSNVVTVMLIVNAVNDAPVAIGDAYTTDEDMELTVLSPGVLTNDGDVDGDTLSVTHVTVPGHGMATINPDGTVTYTPAADFNGSDSFEYTASDGKGAEDTATVSITVIAVNDAPLTEDDVANTAEDTSVTIDVLANDTDVDGDVLTVSAVTSPAHGTATMNSDGTVTYTPDADYHGDDSFGYTASDGNGGTDTATVSIAVAAVNDAPVASDDAYGTEEDTLLSVTAPGVLSNDTDLDGDGLTAVLASDPLHGTLTLSGDGSFLYTPDGNWHGTDSFTYQAWDPDLALSEVVTVTITVNAVNDAPVAIGDAYTTDEDTELTVPLPGVLGNDDDVDGDVLTAVLVSDVSNGTLTLSGDGSFVYTPDADWNGTDSFTYEAQDPVQALSEVVTVTLTVNAVNDAPVAVDDSASTDADTPIAIAVLANDTDVDGDALSVTEVTDPAHGTVIVNPDGTVEYTPEAGFAGSDSFGYTASDGNEGTDTAIVSVTVTSLQECHLYPIALHVDTLSDVAVGDVVDDIFNGNGPGNFGWLTWAGDNSVPALTTSLTPPGNSETYVNPYAASDSLVSVGDWVEGSPGVSNARAVRAALDELKTLDIAVPVWDAVEGQGANAEYQIVSFALVRLIDYRLPSQNRISVRFLGQADCGIQTGPDNQPPAAMDDAATTDQNTSVTIDVLGNDEDIDGDPLTAVLVAGPSHGTVALNGDGSFVYAPHSDYHGSDSFTYLANDGAAVSNVATVTITVQQSDACLIQGLVWDDFDNDGGVDLGEYAVSGVTIILTGTDDAGQVVNMSQATDEQGIYEFVGLRPGTYTITEDQATVPVNYNDGKDVVGEVSGVVTGDNDGGDPPLSTTDDQFTSVVLGVPGLSAINYNFAERLDGGQDQTGQTATIGFWQNKDGRHLVKSLNGAADSQLLGGWLAETFPNMYGVGSSPLDSEPGMNLDGLTNAEIHKVYRQLYKRKSKDSPGGPRRVDAQVMAVALATYSTKEGLAGLLYDSATGDAVRDPSTQIPIIHDSLFMEVEDYGFDVTVGGLGATYFDVGDSGEAFDGYNDGDLVRVSDLLLATNRMSRDGLLYDDDDDGDEGHGEIDDWETLLRTLANDLFSEINESN